MNEFEFEFEFGTWYPIAEFFKGEPRYPEASVMVTRLDPELPDDPRDITNTYVAYWREHGGWTLHVGRQILDPRCPIEPTHFMPLPYPPVTP